MQLPQVLDLLLVATVGAALCAAATPKVTAQAAFRRVLEGHGWAPRWARHIAWLVPSAELGIAALTVFEPTRTVGAIGAGVVFLAFAAYESWLVRNRPDAACGCFGMEDTASSSRILVTLGLAFGAVLLAATRSEANAWQAGMAIAMSLVLLGVTSVWRRTQAQSRQLRS